MTSLIKKDKKSALVVLSAEIIAGIMISFFAFNAFWEMSETVLKQEKFFFDASISNYFYSVRNPLLTHTMEFISFIGMDGIIIASILIPLFLFYKNKKYEAILFTIIIAFGLLLNIVLKAATGRPRPEEINAIATAQFSSFPSGHSMNSFIFFLALAYFYYRFTRKEKTSIVLAILALVIILLVGISRIYLGVHYPSDVLAGFLAGLLWLVFVLVIEKTISFYRHYRSD